MNDSDWSFFWGHLAALVWFGIVWKEVPTLTAIVVFVIVYPLCGILWRKFFGR